MIARRVFVIALVAAATALPACGGEDQPRSNAERVRELVERFNDAFAGGAYGEACELLHSRRRQQLEFEAGQSCSDILERAAQRESRLVEALADARITSVSLGAGFALVGVEGPTIGAGQAMLERDGDRGWRVSESAAGL